MAEKSGIAWTRSTFNPWIGCTKIGPGCDGCYAEATDARRQFGGGVHPICARNQGDSNRRDEIDPHAGPESVIGDSNER